MKDRTPTKHLSQCFLEATTRDLANEDTRIPIPRRRAIRIGIPSVSESQGNNIVKNGNVAHDKPHRSSRSAHQHTACRSRKRAHARHDISLGNQAEHTSKSLFGALTTVVLSYGRTALWKRRKTYRSRRCLFLSRSDGGTQRTIDSPCDSWRHLVECSVLMLPNYPTLFTSRGDGSSARTVRKKRSGNGVLSSYLFELAASLFPCLSLSPQPNTLGLAERSFIFSAPK